MNSPSPAHPAPIKREAVRNMSRAALQVYTGDRERQESMRLGSSIIDNNGYTSRGISAEIHLDANENDRESSVSHRMPFIFDMVSAPFQISTV